MAGEWDTYGFIVACRERNRVLCCVSGITGPATLGASQPVANFAADLPMATTGERPIVAWCLVKVRVHDQLNDGDVYRVDHRRVTDSKIDGPIGWFPR